MALLPDPLTSTLVSLPVEIVDRICLLADQDDIPSLRLVSRFLNNVATPHLLPELKLYFIQSSFERMINASKHPVISKHVKKLVYRTNTLRDMPRKNWEDTFPPLPPPPTHATNRHYRRWHRKQANGANASYKRWSRPQLDKDWSIYQDFLEEQYKFITGVYGTAQLVEAISRFTQLSIVSMGHEYCTWNPKKSPYRDVLQHAGRDPASSYYLRIYQMHSLLSVIHQAGTQLRVVKIDDFITECAQQDDLLKLMRDLATV